MYVLPQKSSYLIEMKVITDGMEKLIDLVANDTFLQLPTFRHEVMPCLLHRVTKLAKLQLGPIKAAALGALMGVTTVDEGKKAMVPAGGVPLLITLLSDPSRLVRLNAVKTVANVAAFPTIRQAYMEDPAALKALTLLERGEDDLLARHAGVAKRVVLWTP